MLFVIDFLSDELLATGATNGNVIIWDLNKIKGNKMDVTFSDHKRTVNKVCFHPRESDLLLSGSQGGSMKCFVSISINFIQLTLRIVNRSIGRIVEQNIWRFIV